MSDSWWHNILGVFTLKISFKHYDSLRKAACLFAGLGHLQPLLLATTNANYLLDRFCMERCCSSEYVSRIVTSIIFMEILSIIVVRIVLIILPTGLGTIIGVGKSSVLEDPNLSTTDKLNWWTEWEERWRDSVSAVILCLITMGYLQILLAFLSGGKKGHMHWFYVSLLIQHFLNSLIAGSIGFWEVGLALWYLVTLPMAPIVIFFYQMIMHSWIRNNGPRYPERLIVERQIWLALSISAIATFFWVATYSKPIIPIELNLENPTESSNNKITQTDVKLTIVTIKSANYVARTVKIAVQPERSTQTVTLTVKSATLNLTLTTPDTSKDINIYSVTRTATVTLTGNSVSGNVPLTLKSEGATVNIQNTSENIKIYSVKIPATVTTEAKITVPVTPDVDVKKPNVTVNLNSDITVTIKSKTAVTLTTVNSATKNSAVTLALTGTITEPTISGGESDRTLTIPLTKKNEDSQNVTAQPTSVQYTHRTFTPAPGYCIYSVKGDGNERDIWASGEKKCLYAECYSNSGQSKLLHMTVYTGNTFNTNLYFGKDNTGRWKTIPNGSEFYKEFKKLKEGTDLGLSDQNTNKDTDQYNREYNEVLGPWNKPAATWAPLIMQGLSVGAVGSIFPNLIPKTLTCPKTTRNLSVMNMFLVTVPHIFNVMLGDMDLLSRIGVGAPWEGGFHTVWLLYIIYALAILFAIFNIHYPEWRLSCFLRNNTWMVFLMILFTDVLNETFNAISRAGICSQKSAKDDHGKKKNHPCLHNKIACLMNLTYIPFWMTTTPMMKSYVSSLDPFLCDKDRDHWPTARYGRLRSFGYWCKCGLRGLYNSPRKLVTLNMRKALTRKDPKMYFLVTHDLPPED